MSLINDALRRTKQVQQQAPPVVAPGPPLQPLETGPLPARGRGSVRLALPCAAGLLALFLILQGVRGHRAAPPSAALPAERGSSAVQPASPTSTGYDAAGPVPLSAGERAMVGAESPRSPVEGTESATNGPSSSIAITSEPGSATNAPVEAAPETSSPGPRPIRLQAIVFHPTRPSAMINGKTLFIGDMLGEMQLVAIGRESATLVGGGQTNLLTLR